jgi:hypothetical protein
MGRPASVTVVSRDEAKQHAMRLELMHQAMATDDVIYNESAKRARFGIGDVRSYADMRRYTERTDVIFHAAALKQVPTCEYHGPRRWTPTSSVRSTWRAPCSRAAAGGSTWWGSPPTRRASR